MKNKPIINGTKKIPTAPRILIIAIDIPISFSSASTTCEAPAIAEEPHIPFPIPSNKDNLLDNFKSLPKISDNKIELHIKATIEQIVLKSIEFNILMLSVEPSKIIAILSSVFSENFIPSLKISLIEKNCLISIPIIMAMATEPIMIYEEINIEVVTIILIKKIPGRIDFNKFKL